MHAVTVVCDPIGLRQGLCYAMKIRYTPRHNVNLDGGVIMNVDGKVDDSVCSASATEAGDENRPVKQLQTGLESDGGGQNETLHKVVSS